LKNITSINENAITVIFAEQDTKEACMKLQSLIQVALLKLAQAMSDALDHKTSPYVLSQKELQDIALKERSEQIMLTSEIENVYTSITVNDNQYRFIFAIPVLDNKASFRLYSARAIPIFGPKDTVILTPPDIRYLGISVDTTKYVELTRHEYVTCLKNSFCKISGIPMSFNAQASCTASAYRHNEIRCEPIKYPNATPFFATYGNKTIYSVPADYHIDTICPNLKARNNAEAVRGTSIISFVGELYINENCFIKLPDDRIIENQQNPEKSTALGISNIVEALKFAPAIDNYLFNWTTPELWSTWVDPPELDIQHNWNFDFDWLNTLNKLVDPTSIAADTIKTLIAIAVILFFFAILYKCYPKLQTWFKTWALISNPRKYWTEVKNYNVQGFEKLPRARHIIRRSRAFRWPCIRNQRHNQLDPLQQEQAQELALRRNFEMPNNTNDPIIRPNQMHNLVPLIQPSAPSVVYNNNSEIQYPRIFQTPLPDIPPLDAHRPRHNRRPSTMPPQQVMAAMKQEDPVDEEEWDAALHRATERLKALNAKHNTS